MQLKKILYSGLLGIAISISSLGIAYGQTHYQVQTGDTYWIISQKFGVSLSRLMEANHANGNEMLYIGQNLVIPSNTPQTIHTVQAGDTYWIISQKYGVDINELMAANNANPYTILHIGHKITIPSQVKEVKETIYTVQAGDTYWIISQKYQVDLIELMAYNGHNENTILHIGQKIKIPEASSNTGSSSSSNSTGSEESYVTYTSYTVQKGDTMWSVSNQFGIPQQELADANNITTQTVFNIGDTLRIPVHHVPVKNTPGEQYGEYLDWWAEAQYVLPIGAEFKVTDFYTGKSFMAKRTTGTNHADVETLTSADTNIMKEIWSGCFSWEKRPIVIEYNGRKLAASAAGMPHAGNENVPGGEYTSWRSYDYGEGYNLDWVKNNGMEGVIDVHFANSTRHKDNTEDDTHQWNVKVAAGIK